VRRACCASAMRSSPCSRPQHRQAHPGDARGRRACRRGVSGYYAGLPREFAGEHLDLGVTRLWLHATRAARWSPHRRWNYPLQIACWKSAPALACGNAMISSRRTHPAHGHEASGGVAAAGLPEGVFQVVQGQAQTGGSSRAIATSARSRSPARLVRARPSWPMPPRLSSR